jgi:hypothetical protein
LVHHGLRLYSVAINNRCNRVALWRIWQKLGSITCNKEQQVLQIWGFSSLQGNHYRPVS